MLTSRIVSRFLKAEIPIRAAALAYHTLLGIVPIVGLIFSYLNVIGVTKKWRDLLQNFLLSHINVTSSQSFMLQFEKLTSAAHTLSSSLIGLAVLLYTSYNLVTKLGSSLDVIFHTAHEKKPKNAAFYMLMLRRTAVLVGLPLAVMLSVVTASWLQRDSWMHYLFKLQSVGPYLALPIPLALDIFALFMVYQFVPQHPGPWKESLRAACLAGPVFNAAKFGMSVYNRHAVMTLKLYGALAAIPIFIIWVQFAWIVVLTGALLIRNPALEPPAPTTKV